MIINLKFQNNLMNTPLLLLGLSIIIFGVVISYIVISSVLKIQESMTNIINQAKGLTNTQKNQIINNTLIGEIIIVVGFLVVREALKR
jgi:uncharacterized membrane protein YidH (DUF202 family)